MRRSAARKTAATLGAVLGVCLFALEARSQPSGGTAAEPITLERIASDLDWLGNAPERAYWAEDGASVLYFRKRTGSGEASTPGAAGSAAIGASRSTPGKGTSGPTTSPADRDGSSPAPTKPRATRGRSPRDGSPTAGALACSCEIS